MNNSELIGDIVSGTIAGIVTGVLLPATLFLINWIRNKRLEAEIRDRFGQCSVGREGKSFYVIVENHLPIEVRIRAVVLVGKGEGPWHLHLKYLGPAPQTALLNAIGLDNHPVRIIAASHFSTEVDPNVAISLPGFAGGMWGVSCDEFLTRPWPIHRVDGR